MSKIYLPIASLEEPLASYLSKQLPSDVSDDTSEEADDFEVEDSDISDDGDEEPSDGESLGSEDSWSEESSNESSDEESVVYESEQEDELDILDAKAELMERSRKRRRVA